MATKLTKEVTREVEDWGGSGKEAARAMLVTMHPAGFISFRLKGTRQAYDLSVGSAFHIAVRKLADKQMEERRRERESRRNGLS